MLLSILPSSLGSVTQKSEPHSSVVLGGRDRVSFHNYLSVWMMNTHPCCVIHSSKHQNPQGVLPSLTSPNPSSLPTSSIPTCYKPGPKLPALQLLPAGHKRVSSLPPSQSHQVEMFPVRECSLGIISLHQCLFQGLMNMISIFCNTPHWDRMSCPCLVA